MLTIMELTNEKGKHIILNMSQVTSIEAKPETDPGNYSTVIKTNAGMFFVKETYEVIAGQIKYVIAMMKPRQGDVANDSTADETTPS